jgi:NifB/MoaA-like Fe-S oxidoreductase
MEYVYNKIEDKFSAIISFLKQLSSKVEMIADEIDNENLKNAMRAFAVDTNQYANELKAEIKNLNINNSFVDFNNLIEEVTATKIDLISQEKGKEILTFCESCEAFFHKMYNEFLYDLLPNMSLKNIISYQLMGIKSAFMRIKTLNELRFNH